MNLSKPLVLAASLLLVNSSLATPTFIDFSDGDGAMMTTSASAPEFKIAGTTWSGGEISASADPALRSAGFSAFEVSSGQGSVVFDRPVAGVRFFFAHGHGVPEGTATAYSADGIVLGTAKSQLATTFGDSRNFVRFDSKQPIAAVTFSGGAIDSFQTQAFDVDYKLVQGAWVNNDVEENNAEGLFFDYLATESALFMAWFAYDSEIKMAPTASDGDVGSPDNRWLTARFDTDTGSNLLTGTIFASSGGEFNSPRTAYQVTEEVGSISIDFVDCDRALVSYDLQTPAISGNFEIIPVEKQVNPDGFSCDAEPPSLMGQYAGSENCAICHQSYYEGWKGTIHPDMNKPAAEGMWDISREFIEAELAKGDSPFLEIGGNRGRVTSIDDIVYTNGHRWKQRFVVQTDEGHAFMRLQMNPAFGDTPARGTVYTENRIYEDRCLACHTTGFDLELSRTIDRTAEDYTLASTVSELGVSCEACHGPGAAHMQQPFRKDLIVNPGNLSARAQTEFCGTCHARNAGHNTIAGRNDPIGYEFGMDVRDVTKVLSVVTNEYIFKGVDADGNVNGYFDPGGTRRFWEDGTARSHRMQYQDLEGNRMKAQFGFTCTTCHDVHHETALKGGSWEGLLMADLGQQSCANCHFSKINRGWSLDEAMPYNANNASGVRDQRMHTFGTNFVSPDIPLRPSN